MTAELQPLIDRIQKEAVDKARAKTEEILAEARRKAESLVKEAEDKAQALLQKADQDAKAFSERSARTLEQAARDVLITVGQGIDRIVSQLVSDELDRTLSGDSLADILGRAVEAYARDDRQLGGLEVLVSPEDQQALLRIFKQRYAERIRQGVEVKADGDIIKGFQISFDGGRVRHDFTREAMVEALSRFLRPQLAGMLKGAVTSGGTAGGRKP